MGSSSKTRKTKEAVTKERGIGGSVGSGGGGEVKDRCAFSIKIEIPLTSESAVRAGDFASITLAGADKLVIVIGEALIGTYSGSKKEELLECIGKGFVYEGKVVATNDLNAVIEVKGNG